ncbi:MAG: hypothetical protein V8Q27_00545 [Eubacteriales bacterium]
MAAGGRRRTAETLEDALKSNVLEILAEIHLLCAHADEYGVTLTEEEQEAIREPAANFMKTNTQEVLRGGRSRRGNG